MFDFLGNLSPASWFSNDAAPAPAMAHEAGHAVSAPSGGSGGAADLGYASHYAEAGTATAHPPLHPLTQAEMHELMDDSPSPSPAKKPTPPRHPLTQAEMHELMDDKPAAPAPAPAKKFPDHVGKFTQEELRDLLE